MHLVAREKSLIAKRSGYRDSYPRGTRAAELTRCQTTDFMTRRLIIGSLTVHRWFIDVNERRGESIAAL